MSNVKTILQMGPDEARAFFLKPESYCDLELPNYLVFDNILKNVASYLSGKIISSLYKAGTRPSDFEQVNHLLLNNKDGKHAWRPYELIHPVLYCDLVHTITSEENWRFIIRRFKEFSEQEAVICMSIPVESTQDRKDKEAQIFNWWTRIEQKSIQLALEFEVIAHTDITDCYGQIYTHSIAWALHGKAIAKAKRRDTSLIGNAVDRAIQDMRHGQTNGIPQGTKLMHFIAEMVLGYADILLAEKLRTSGLTEKEDFRILRYRDDYRIFTHSEHDAEKILKALTEVLIELGLKLNSVKTRIDNEVIRASIKEDKLAWFLRKQSDRGLQKHLLIIHDHARSYPNSGSILRALSDFRRRLDKLDKRNETETLVLISIITDIAFNNPRTYPICAAILSRLLRFLEKSRQESVLRKICHKFSRIPNTGYLEVWLQRIALPLDISLDLKEPLCKIVTGEKKDSLWNNEWIGSNELCSIMETPILDEKTLEDAKPIIPASEVELFLKEYWP